MLQVDARLSHEATVVTAAPATVVEPARRPYRWLILAAMVLVFFSTYFIRLAWTNVSASTARSLGSSASELGLFFTFFYTGYVTTNVLGGLFVDRLGGRRVLILTFGAFAVATATFGLVTNPEEGLLTQLAMGAASGSFYAAIVKIVAPWFAERERGFAFSLISMAGPFAIVIANLLYPVLIPRLGWNGLYEMLGIYAVAVTLIVVLVVREVGPSAARLPARACSPPSPPPVRRFDRQLLLISAAGFGASWGTYGFTFCSNLLLVKSHRFDAADAAIVATLFGVGGTLAIPLYGLLSDRIAGHRPQMVILGLLVFPAALALFGVQSTLIGFSVAGFVLGIAAYAFWPLFSAMLADFIDHGRLGASAGIANASWQSANVVVPFVAGLIIDKTGSLAAALISLALGPIFGALCLVLFIRDRARARRTTFGETL
jgi:MFS family permease